MDERLKLTTEQRKVWTKFVSAMKKCDAYGIGFIINGDGCIYAANETDVNGYSFKDDVKDEDSNENAPDDDSQEKQETITHDRKQEKADGKGK